MGIPGLPRCDWLEDPRQVRYPRGGVDMTRFTEVPPSDLTREFSDLTKGFSDMKIPVT